MDNINEHDKKLIEEHEKEEEYYENIIDLVLEEEEALDKLIAERMEYIEDSFDFEPSPEYERLEELYYESYDNQFQEQISDVDDYIDYPEGPDENLNGIKYGEEYFDDFEIEWDIDQLEDVSPDFYEQLVDDAFEYQNDEDRYLEDLIKQHLEEEKTFLDNILVETIVEESIFEKAIDELIFEGIDIPYEPELIDYETNVKIRLSELKTENNQLNENKEEIKSVFKDYYTKDNTLNKIIKEKLKDKKFNYK